MTNGSDTAIGLHNSAMTNNAETTQRRALAA